MRSIVTEKILKNEQFYPNLRFFIVMILFQIGASFYFYIWEIGGNNDMAAGVLVVLVGLTTAVIIQYISRVPIKIIFLADRIEIYFAFVKKERPLHELDGLQLKHHQRKPPARTLINKHWVQAPYLSLDLIFGNKAFQLLPSYMKQTANNNFEANRKMLTSLVEELKESHLLPDLPLVRAT